MGRENRQGRNSKQGLSSRRHSLGKAQGSQTLGCWAQGSGRWGQGASSVMGGLQDSEGLHPWRRDEQDLSSSFVARSQKTSGIGRLMVHVIEATELKACKPNGKSNPYCEISMGSQSYTTRTIQDTLNPKWNFNCQFFIKDLYQDVLCLTLFDRDQFSPDDFLGRTEIPVAKIRTEQESKGPVTRRLLLHEVPTGEVWVRFDLQLFEQKTLL